jgi:tetratricopeptide (TPR) repeat protein
MEPQVADVLDRAREAVLAQETAATWGELGAVYDAHGLLAEAETCYGRARELDPSAFEWTYLLAIVREVRGAGTEEVVALFDRAAAARPDYPPIHVRLGAALTLRGEQPRAREAFERAVELAPDHAVAHRGLGQVLLALDEAGQAADHLSRAVELEPRDLSAHSGLAQAYMRLGMEDRARQVVDRSRDLEPINAFDDPVYGERVFMRSVSSSRAFSRAQAALRIGAWAQAEQDLALVLRARPDDASAHYWKGLAHRRLGQNGAALMHLSRAVEIEPAMARARIEMGAMLVGEQRFEEAVQQLELAEKLGALDADGYFGLGLAYEGLDRPDEARARYEAAARLDPDHPAASRLRGQPR